MLARFSAVALVALVASQAQAALSIDGFNMTNQSQDGVGANTVAAVEAIGGFRTLEVVSITPGSLSATLAVGPVPAIGLSLSNDTGESSVSQVVWDADGTGLGGVDLTQGGLIDNFFELAISSIDVGLVDLTLTVADTLGGLSSASMLGAGVGTETVSFASFVGDVDFTTVDSITLSIDSDENSDLSLDYLKVDGRVIPEPTSALVFSVLGLVGVCSLRRRRKP
jgi:hypothetical protein